MSTAVVDLLPLPTASRLTEEQGRGAVCVWCTITLTGETAIDLGTRPAPGGGQMFPRGCLDCVKHAALKEYGDHTGTCEQCVDDPTLCATRRALRRLALDGRR